MRPNTPKRAAQKRVYQKRRDEYMAEHPACEFPNCGRRSEELHHRKGRVGALLTDVRYFAALCSNCHRFVTEHPAEAYRLGVSLRRVGGRTA